MLYKVIVAFTSVDKILKNSNETEMLSRPLHKDCSIETLCKLNFSQN